MCRRSVVSLVALPAGTNKTRCKVKEILDLKRPMPKAGKEHNWFLSQNSAVVKSNLTAGMEIGLQPEGEAVLLLLHLFFRSSYDRN
jgi:hypothetical protein